MHICGTENTLFPVIAARRAREPVISETSDRVYRLLTRDCKLGERKRWRRRGWKTTSAWKYKDEERARESSSRIFFANRVSSRTRTVTTVTPPREAETSDCSSLSLFLSLSLCRSRSEKKLDCKEQ
ncbi:hypothetical protein PUN28_016484 [Cardiocondyla obscurior]|uniref:Uncharacterized protein n=1 Tax=Cardiocondyla obscurior TaxID=286306 RepID=A0AAW2ENI4_9HYME